MKYGLDTMLPERAFQPRGKGPFGMGMTLEGGGGGGIVSVVVDVVAVVASVYAGPEVGAAILDSMAVEGASAATVAAVGSAAIAGSTSAVNAAVQGKNVEGVLAAGAEGAAAGAAGSLAGGAVSDAVTGATGGPVAVPSDLGPTLGANAPGAIAGGAASGGVSGFTGAELAGQNLNQSLRQGEIGAATGFATSALGEGLKGAGVPSETAKDITTVASPFVGQNIANLFTPQTSSQTVGRPGESSVTTTGQAGTTPGSQALAQALQVGSPDVGAPVQSPGGGESAKQPVWNVASLRTMDQTGSPDSGSSA